MRWLITMQHTPISNNKGPVKGSKLFRKEAPKAQVSEAEQSVESANEAKGKAETEYANIKAELDEMKPKYEAYEKAEAERVEAETKKAKEDVIAQYEVAQFAGDDRALFYTEGRKLNVEDESVFTNGFAVAKFTNFTTDGSAVGAGDNRMPNMNVFMMRKAEAYLTYAEALARQNGGIAPAEALAALNVLRNRAHASVLSSANLNTILDEWGREFFFEGRRRIDLVRHNKFGGNTGYNWQWKGGVYAGRNFDAYRNIFDIPQSDIIANNNLQHNPGYPLK